MSIATFLQTLFTGQDPTTYKSAIDGNFSVLSRLGQNFAAHAQATPAMTVAVDAGHVFDGSTLTEVAAQSTGTITAPVTHARIDRIVRSATTGVVSVITGTEAASPVAPAITAGTVPVARVSLAVGVSAITNSMMTDERDAGAAGAGFGAETSIASATTVDLGTVPSRNALITGTTTITSFGSSASTNQPIYLLNFNGVLTLTNSGSLTLPGSASITTAANDTAIAEYLGSGSWRVISYSPASGQAIASSAPMGLKFGLKLTYNNTVKFTIAAGQATDSTGFVQMTVASTLTVNTGNSGALGIDTGSVTASLWYHVHLISGTSGVSALLSLSATAPTMPTGYTYFRRIGSVKINSSSGITQFVHVVELDTFYWSTLVQDYNASISTYTAITLSVPPAVRVQPLVRYGSTSSGVFLIMFSGDEPAANASNTNSTSPGVDTLSNGGTDYAYVTTNTSGQIYIANGGGSGANAVVYTRGWIDRCGRFG